MRERLLRLADAVGMDEAKGRPVALVRLLDGRWMLTGTACGDTVLPNTYGCRTPEEAAGAFEAWLEMGMGDR